MPEYDFFCKCGEMGSRIVPVDDRDTQICTCGKIMKRKIALPGKAIVVGVYRDAPRYAPTIHKQPDGYRYGKPVEVKR